MNNSLSSKQRETTNATIQSNQPDRQFIARTVQENEQATAVMRQNQTGAATLAEDSNWEYVLLRQNNRSDDGGEVVAAAGDATSARYFLALFKESFDAFSRSAEYGRLLLGEQAKWQPTLQDGQGNLIGSLDPVLLNPTRPQLGGKPAIQIILPNVDYLQLVSQRPDPAQRQALDKGLPVAWIDRPINTKADQTVTELMKLMMPATATDTEQRTTNAMSQYKQAQQTIPADDVPGLRRMFEQIATRTLELTGAGREVLVDKLLEVNPLYRSTLHPDSNLFGRQIIHTQLVPVTYKGVELQPAQVRNLLLGNTIEVAGLQDTRRPGLYRAVVHFNVLQQQPEERSSRVSNQKETLQTESKREYQAHQQTVHQQGSEQLTKSTQSETRNQRSNGDDRAVNRKETVRHRLS